MFNVIEPVQLVGEGEYNLNNLKEIKVTEAYLGLDQDIRECQNEEPFYNCTTRHYIDNLLSNCGCLPLNIKQMHQKVLIITSCIQIYYSNPIIQSRNLYAFH